MRAASAIEQVSVLVGCSSVGAEGCSICAIVSMRVILSLGWALIGGSLSAVFFGHVFIDVTFYFLHLFLLFFEMLSDWR